MIMFAINACLGFALMSILIYVLFAYPDEHILLERIGLGISGSAAFLSLVRMFAPNTMAPFNDLFQLLWRTGWLFVIGGRVFRHYRHWRGNKIQAAIGADWFHERAQQSTQSPNLVERIVYSVEPPEPPRTLRQKLWLALVKLDDHRRP